MAEFKIACWSLPFVCALSIACDGGGARDTSDERPDQAQQDAGDEAATDAQPSSPGDGGMQPAMDTAGTAADPPACERTTCRALGRTCGSSPDGCGGALSCGTCPSPMFCDQDGTCVADVECLEGAAAVHQGDVSVSGVATLDLLVGVRRIEGNLTIDRVQQATLAQLSCLQEVSGDLSIGPVPTLQSSGGLSWGDPGLSSLRGLDSLTIVGGSLRIRGGSMVDLGGLDRLQSVGGSLAIGGLAQLASLSALAQLRELSELNLVDLPALSSLVGLEGVSRLPGWIPMNILGSPPSLDIARCGALRDLTGLDGLEHLGKLRLQDNTALVSLAGLDAVRTVGCEGASFECDASQMSFELRDNPELADVSALSAAAGAIGELLVYGAERLLDLTDLHNLQFTELSLSRNAAMVRISSTPFPVSSIDDLYINELTDLETLDGLDNVAVVRSAGGINIRDNPALRTLAGLAAVTEVRGSFIVRRSPVLAALSFPVLQRIDGSVYLEDLPMVPSCEVDALLARAGAECTRCGPFDENATCP